MTFSRDERLALCDLLLQLGPHAPTLCDGWSTQDLAAHLWVRENDPVALPGILTEPLATLTQQRMERAIRRHGFAELVAQVRRGPARHSPFRLPGVDQQGNAAEYFVHHEDVRRAQPGGAAPRRLGQAAQTLCATRLASLGPALLRGAPVGVVAVRTDGPARSTVLKPGQPSVEVHGLPSELLLFAFGRGSHAAVELHGPEQAVAQLRAASFGI
ncbi:TIGR03085 family metal-binding protein [Luteococcus sp. OSA5]|uniref:TIGR03085 family metal-binding protein n=1 Tax=Luteococcus sp. OSA5 TaxID=3401630 RepID=UPI003B42C15F